MFFDPSFRCAQKIDLFQGKASGSFEQLAMNGIPDSFCLKLQRP
jgi:hypothetical protein